MPKNSNKTPAERIIEAERKLDKLRQNAARSEAEKLPQLAVIQETLASYNKDATRISRTIGTFDYRIESNRLHGLAIVAERNFTRAEESVVKARREYLNSILADFATRISNGETITTEMVNDAITVNLPGENISELREIMDKAHEDWRNYIASNKNKQSKTENTLEKAVSNMNAATA